MKGWSKTTKVKKMTDIFSKWDAAVDTKGLQEDVEKAAEGGGSGEFKEVPFPGKYEVAVSKMELKASSKGDPMVSIWFKIVSGEYENSLIFYNQVITQGFQIHKNNEFLRALSSSVNIEFVNYSQYNDLLLDVFEEVSDNFEYALKVTPNKKNSSFNDFEIAEVFELQ